MRYAHSVLNGALRQAIRWQRLARNPAALVDLPRQPRREMKALDAAQARCFIATAATGVEHRALRGGLLLGTGLRRPSEALGLRWTDLDADRLHVQRALTRFSDGTLEFNEPKTARGRVS